MDYVEGARVGFPRHSKTGNGRARVDKDSGGFPEMSTGVCQTPHTAGLKTVLAVL